MPAMVCSAAWLALGLQLPGAPSLLFLAFLFLFLPWVALRSAHRLRAARDGSSPGALPSREAIWTSTLISQAVLLALAWLTGRGFGYPFFALPSPGLREMLAALAALGASFGLRAILRAAPSKEERRRLTVYALAPRTPREWALWTATVLAASVAEETAYRGVGMAILWYSLGNPWISALLCALAFALAHGIQGWKSAVVIFVIALVMHGLVVFTGTLVLAIVVHAVYDLVAGYRIAREAGRNQPEAAAA